MKTSGHSPAIGGPGLIRKAATFLLLLVLASSFTAPAMSHERTRFDELFGKLILDRIQAYGRGDVQAYTALLADGFVHISDLGERRTSAQMRAYVGGHGDDHASFKVTSLFWLLKGDLAVVDAEVQEHRLELDLAMHETDIFVLRGARWRYLRHQETARWKSPVAVAVPGDRLDDYAGRYRTKAGAIDIIALRHRKLFDQLLPSDARVPFVHVARGAFGFSDDPTLAVFLRNSAGKVTQCLWHLPSGQTIVSQRIQ